MGLDSLRKLAQEATRGEWKAEGSMVYVLHGDPPRNRFDARFQAGRRDDASETELIANARYIAALSPDVVLLLLDAVEAARRVVGEFDGCRSMSPGFAALRAALDALEAGETEVKGGA